MRKHFQLAALALIAFGSPAAKKDRDWKTGKIMAARTVNTGTASERDFPNLPMAPNSVTSRTMTATELEIFGGDFAYTVRSLGTVKRFLSLGVYGPRRCRYIVGDEIKYAQERSVLYLSDADGQECRAEIMVQERLPAGVKDAAPAQPPKP